MELFLVYKSVMGLLFIYMCAFGDTFMLMDSLCYVNPRRINIGLRLFNSYHLNFFYVLIINSKWMVIKCCVFYIVFNFLLTINGVTLSVLFWSLLDTYAD